MRVIRLTSADDHPARGPPSPSSSSSPSLSNPQTTFTQTIFNGPSMLATRRETISRVTLHTQLDLLKSTGRYDCFELKWHPIYDDHRYWPVPPHLFWDSDLGKWMEGAIYFLAQEDHHDPELDEAIRHIVGTVKSAQQEDGYLNLHYLVVEPGKRWTNIRDMHEMYNAGHLLEAALAHHHHYRNNDFLDVMTRYVHLMHATFGPGPGQKRAYPGHPELELALLRLYKTTGDTKAYDLARFFLTERGSSDPTGQQQGQGGHYYDWEMARRGEEAHKRPNSYPMARDYWYCQAHAPILAQQSVEGHAVRATYLLTAVADLVALHPQQRQQDDYGGNSSSHPPRPLANVEEWRAALSRLWDNMVSKKMYLTGSVGAVAQWEGFGIDYFLPQAPDEGGCYAETCASIGVMMLAERLLAANGGTTTPAGHQHQHHHQQLNAQWADVMEMCLYNTVMGSMSLDGKAFTYENYLASCSGSLCQREGWFECSCCPPNVGRLFGSLGGYLWHYGSSNRVSKEEGVITSQVRDDEVFINVHMYTTAKLEFKSGRGHPVSLQQKTNWPWESNILFTLENSPFHHPVQETVRLRVPRWSGGEYVLTPTPARGQAATLGSDGYLHLSPSYTAANRSFSVAFGGMRPRFLAPHPYSGQRTLSLARGPIVYCVEDVDNPWEDNHFKDVVLLDDKAPVLEIEMEWKGEMYIALKTSGRKRAVVRNWDVTGAAPVKVQDTLVELVFVPYYLRANRGGRGHMRVGLLKY